MNVDFISYCNEMYPYLRFRGFEFKIDCKHDTFLLMLLVWEIVWFLSAFGMNISKLTKTSYLEPRGGDWCLGGFEISRAGTYPKYLAETVISFAYTTRNTAIETAIFVSQILETYHPRVWK